MAIDPKELPEWEQAEAIYKGNLAAAKKEGDDTAVLKAENGWLQERLNLQELAGQRHLEAQAREQAFAKVKADFPGVPEVVYSKLTNPDEILAAAKEVHDAIAPVQQAANADNAPSGATSWGTQAGGTQTTNQTQYKSQYDDPAYLREQKKLVKAGNKEAIRGMRQHIFSQGILPAATRYSDKPVGTQSIFNPDNGSNV